MKLYRTTEAIRELSLIGQKPFVSIALVNPWEKNMLILMFDEEIDALSVCLPAQEPIRDVGNTRSHGLFFLFSRHLSRVITPVRWKKARSIALMREGVTYPFRKMKYLCHRYDSVDSFNYHPKILKGNSYANKYLYESYWAVPRGWSF